MRATAPPCRFPVELQRDGTQWRVKIVAAVWGLVGETVAERRVRD